MSHTTSGYHLQNRVILQSSVFTMVEGPGWLNALGSWIT